MRNKRIPTNAAQRLQDKAKRLINKIFRFLPCAVCLSFGKSNYETVPCHLLNKGLYGSKRYKILNLLPLCSEHHTNGTEISSHAWGANTSVIKNFTAWLKNTLPLHYKWYIENKEDRAPHKLSLGDLSEICNDLQYYAENPDKAEELIYEKA